METVHLFDTDINLDMDDVQKHEFTYIKIVNSDEIPCHCWVHQGRPAPDATFLECHTDQWANILQLNETNTCPLCDGCLHMVIKGEL